MRPVIWMILVCGASWLALTKFSAAPQGPEVFVGMLGPLVAAGGSWAVVERTHRANPARVPRVMLAAFFAKMLFFAAYVVVAVGVFRLQPARFAISFTCYFVTLHLSEAFLLRRLFAMGVPPPLS
jgi:hypothetical protein